MPYKLLPRLLFLLLVFLSACATANKPLTGIIPGKEVETLQSQMSISIKSGDQSTSGRGFLVFKQPDRFHMAILSPFGLTLFELFSDRDRLTSLIPSRETAYSGLLSELPDTSPLKSISMMRWVVVRPPMLEPPAVSNVVTAQSGDKFFFDERGLVERKVSPEGDQVAYKDYHNRNGVAFPDTIVITSRYGATVKVVFDDPDVNSPVEESALIPNLEGYTVLPLTEFKGF